MMADYDAQPGRLPPSEPEISRAQLESDDTDLNAGLTGLAGIVAGGRGVVDLLSDVAEFAAQAIPGVDGAGVTLMDTSQGTPQPDTWAATAQFVRDIDAVQYDTLHEGPCITCMQSRRPTVSAGVPASRRG